MAAEGTGKPTIIYNKKIKKLYKIEAENSSFGGSPKELFFKLLNERLNRRTEENNERT